MPLPPRAVGIKGMAHPPRAVQRRPLLRAMKPPRHHSDGLVITPVLIRRVLPPLLAVIRLRRRGIRPPRGRLDTTVRVMSRTGKTDAC